MKKRIYSLLVVMAMTLSFVQVIANAEQGTKYGDYLYYEVNEGNTITITDCDTSAQKVKIPSEINGISVTAIGDNAFAGCNSLVRIEIPKSIRSIGHLAFTQVPLEDIYYLGSEAEWENIEINHYDRSGDWGYGNMILSPEFGALRFNTSMPADDDETAVLLDYLTLDRQTGKIMQCDPSAEGNLVIPSTIDGIKISSINESAFRGCNKLTSISIPDSVSSIGEYAFSECSSLKNIKIPENISSIGDGIFSGCSSLTSIRLPQKITSIGECAFLGCSSLKSIVIPNNVTSIGNSAFCECSALKSVSMSNNIKSIDERAFAECISLESIRIPGSVTSIAQSVFEYCDALRNVYIGDGITSIGEMAFGGCELLTNVRIPKSLVKVEESAFNMCENVEKVYYLGDSNSWSKIKFEEDNYSVEEDAEIIYGEMPENMIVTATEEPDEPEETAKPEEPKPTETPAETKSSDEVSVTLNGNGIIFDQPPVIIDGRTLVPMRAIFEAMGCDVEWDGETKTIEAFNADGDKVIEMQVGSENMWSAGNPSITLDVPPQIINDRTLVPVRAISESMGAEVNWHGDTRNVEIIYN